MKKIVRLTERDLTRIVRQVINEEKTYRSIHEININKISKLIKESAEAMVDDVEQQMNSGKKPDQDIMSQIKSCIKKHGLTNLMVLTTGAGAYALGLIALLMGSGLGAPFALMMSGSILIILEGVAINGKGVAEEVEKLVSCMGY